MTRAVEQLQDSGELAVPDQTSSVLRAEPRSLTERFDRSVSLLSWAYNEELNIAEYLARASALMDATVKDHEIILIDDGSTDRTYEIAKSVQKQHPRLRVFQNGQTRAAAFRTASPSARHRRITSSGRPSTGPMTSQTCAAASSI